MSKFACKIELEPISGKVDKYIKRVNINEDEAKIIRVVFEQYDKGVTKKEITDELNCQGYRVKGKPVTSKSFDKYIVNEKYTGEFHVGNRLYTNMYPQIMDKVLFNRVQEQKNVFVKQFLNARCCSYFEDMI